LQGDPADPTQAVAALLAGQPAASQILVIVDQFEEIFTVAQQGVAAFQTALLHLAQVPQCYVVLTVRADFYADLMASLLWSMVQAHRLEVVPLDESGLRQAIVRPAEALGVFVEPALVERLITDAAGEPGVLPLVQETLVLLWERLERRFLPLGAYHALVQAGSNSGPHSEQTGLQVAMARRADDALRSLSAEQHQIGRRVFLRLVQFGEGRADTRRQQPIDHLRAISDDPDQFDTTLHHLITRRLLTASGHEDGPTQKVDIAHEALISGWPTLHQWLVERREAEQIRRRLEAKANEWARLGRRNGGLLDDVELLEAERWLQSPDAADLGYDAALLEFIQASRSEQAEWLVHQRQVARFRRLSVSVIVLLIITALSIGLWSMQRSLSFARQQARLNTASRLAAQSQSELERYPQRSLLLSVEALSTTLSVHEPPVLAAQESMRKALASTSGYGLSGHSRHVQALAISNDNHLLVTGSWDGTARVWDLTAKDPLAARLLVLRGHEEMILAVAISSNNQQIVTASRDGTVRVWDLTAKDPSAPSREWRGHDGAILSMTISRDNRWLVTGSEDGTVRVWDLTAKDPLAAPSREWRGHDGAIVAVALSSDSQRIVTGGSDDIARVWNLTVKNSPSEPSLVWEGHEGSLWAVTISDHWLVTASRDGTARVWDLTVKNSPPLELRGHRGAIWAMTISRDNRWLVTGGIDGTARVWDLMVKNSPPLELRGHDGGISAVAISNDNRWLVAGASDGTARVWDFQIENTSAESILLQTNGLSPESITVQPITVSKDNHWVVTGGANGTVRMWDLTAKDPSAPSREWQGHDGAISAVAISNDNRWLVTGSEDGMARVWDLMVKDPLVAPSRELRRLKGSIRKAPITDRWLVTDGSDGTIQLWDLTAKDPLAAPLWEWQGHEGLVWEMTISRDNRLLVTVGIGGTARVWNLTTKDSSSEPSLVWEGHEGSLWAVAISDHWFVTGSEDGRAQAWNLMAKDPLVTPSLELQGHEGPIREATITDHWLVTASRDGTVRVWDLTAKGRAAPSLELRGHEGSIHEVAITDRWLVTGDSDGTAQMWDLKVKDPEAGPIMLQVGTTPIHKVVIGKDNRWLVTIGSDGPAQLWPLNPNDLRDLACHAAGRNLTRAEWTRYMPKDEPYRATCPNFPIEPVRQDETPTGA
jgi:WD40 repeat protein